MSDKNIFERISNPSVRGKIWRTFLLILLLVLIGGLIDAGSYYNKGVDRLAEATGYSVKLPHVKEVPFHLGLDLLGGTHLVYTANMSEIPTKDQASALEGVRDVIERRVNVFGVSEPLVQTSVSGGEYRVIVELAGIKDVNEAINMIGETPLLEFKEQSTQERILTDDEKIQMEEFNKQSEEKATDVLGKLISGEDFETLAKEYNQDQNTKETNGDLGWITEKDNPEIVLIANNLEIGAYTKELQKISQGYDLVKLEENYLYY